MTVWIDPPAWPRHGTTFAHLASDTGPDALHEVARAAGLHPRSFDGDHYDVPAQRWHDAVAAGAVVTTARDLMLALNASGWRLRKRHGDRGVARIRDVVVLGSRGDVDVVQGSRPYPNPDYVACQLSDAHGSYAVVWAPARAQWSTPGGHIEPHETPHAAIEREILEETGLRVHDLVEAGYWRFSPGHSTEAPLGTQPAHSNRVLQLFQAQVPQVRPTLRAERAGIPEPHWVDWSEFKNIFADAFWFPLAERVAGIERVYGEMPDSLPG